jgi:hypothetical protein
MTVRNLNTAITSPTGFLGHDGSGPGTLTPVKAGNLAQYTPPGTGAVDRTIAGKLGETISLKDFGAAMDGSTDDTDEWQAAIDYLKTGAGGGVLQVVGNSKLDPASLDFADMPVGFTMQINGKLTVTSGFTLMPGIHIVGVGGATQMAQCQIGPSCEIQQSGTWTEPVVKLIGQSNLYVEGVYVRASQGPSFQIGRNSDDPENSTTGRQSALCRLIRVGALPADLSTAVPLRVENTFWVWIRDFAFNARDSNPWAIDIADSYYPGALNNSTGLIDIRDGVIAGHGINIGRGFSNALQAFHFWFHNVHYEVPSGAFVTIGSEYVDVSDVQISNCNTADDIDAPTLAYVDNTAGGRIRDLKIYGANYAYEKQTPIIGTPPTEQLIYEGFKSISYNADYSTYDVIPKRPRIYLDGEVEAVSAFRGSGFEPQTIPADALVYPTTQDVSAWTIGSGVTVTGGQTAPDGSATAYRIENGNAGAADVYRSTNATGLTAHWLLLGSWVRAYDQSTRLQRDGTGLLYVYPGGATGLEWDDVSSAVASRYASNLRTRCTNAGWLFLSEFYKLEASGAPNDLRLGFYLITTSADYLVWRPFVLALPIASYTKRDAIRVLSSLVNIDTSAKAGVCQTTRPFRTGSSATGSRPSASAVGAGTQWYDTTLGKPIWSNGTDWKDAAGTTV